MNLALMAVLKLLPKLIRMKTGPQTSESITTGEPVQMAIAGRSPHREPWYHTHETDQTRCDTERSGAAVHRLCGGRGSDEAARMS